MAKTKQRCRRRIALDLYRRITKKYDRLEQLDSAIRSRAADHRLWRVEPHVAEKLIREWLEEYPDSTEKYRLNKIKNLQSAVNKPFPL